jgi:CBS-domain-containing membrane protein
MNNKSTNFNNAGNLIGICIAIGVAVFAWLFVNLSPWIAAGFAISAVLTWKIPKIQNED